MNSAGYREQLREFATVNILFLRMGMPDRSKVQRGL